MRFRSFIAFALIAGVLIGLAVAGPPLERAHANTRRAGGGAIPTAAIAFQNVSGNLGTQSGTSAYSVPYTTVSGNNTALIAIYVTNGGIPPVTFTYNSVSCAHIGDADAGAGKTAYVYFCPVGNTVPGAYTLAVTTSLANTTVEACVVEYSGVAQVSATEGVAVTTGGTSSASIAVTTVADNDWAIGVIGNRNAASTGVGAGYTSRIVSASSPGCNTGTGGFITDYVDTNTVVHPPGSTTPTVNFAGAVIWGIVGFGLKHG